MAAPAITVNAIVSGTGSLSPTLPAHQQDDVLFCAYATEDNSATLSAPAGWTAIPASQPNTTGIRMGAWWRRVGVGETVATPSLTKSTGTGASLAVAGMIRGARTSGNPWAASPLSLANASSTTVSVGGGITTTVADTLLVMLVANSTDTGTAQTSAYRAATDPVQASWAEDRDTQTNTASGAGLAVAHAAKTSPGATGNINATLATASVSAALAFEVLPQPGTAETQQIDDDAAIADVAMPVLSVGNVEAEADSAVVTDAVVAAVDHVLQIDDAADASDGLSTVSAYVRQIADTAAGTDQALAGILVQLGLADSAVATDALGAALGLSKALADVVVGTDGFSLAAARGVQITDTAGVSDVVGLAASYAVAISDGAGATDAISGSVARAATITDGAQATDSLSAASAIVRAVGDALVATDQVDALAFAGLMLVQAIDDTAAVADATSRSSAIQRTVQDAIMVEDALSTIASYALTLADAAAAADSVVTARQIARLLGSTAGPGQFGTAEDLIGITDAVVPALAVVFEVEDEALVDDATEGAVQVRFALADDLTAVDDVVADVEAVPLLPRVLRAQSDRATMAVETSAHRVAVAVLSDFGVTVLVTGASRAEQLHIDDEEQEES